MDNKVLSPWSKQVKIALIERDMTVTDLAALIESPRSHVSNVINGNLYNAKTVEKICVCLGVQKTNQTLASRF